MPKLTVFTEDTQRNIPFSPGSSLREILDAAGLGVRSGCRGNGACGLCLVRVEAGNVSGLTENERLNLSSEQIDQDFRLACQLMPENDLSVRIIKSESISGRRDLTLNQLLFSPYLFETFIKLAQYIVRIKSQQDIWDHLGKFITTYFRVDWIAFVQRDPVNGISVHHCMPPDAVVAKHILTDDVRTLITDVLDSGFLASQVILTPAPSMTVFLPIVEEYEQERAIVIGHRSADPLSKELLNIYLAIAGLAGTTFGRLRNERELNRHRAHLEELVKERTMELAEAKRQNELILHSVGEGICGMDLDGKITFVNPSAAKIIGWDPDKLIGRNAHATFHHTRPDGCCYPVGECPVRSAIPNGNAKHIANENFLRRDGSRFPVECMTTPIIDEGGGVIGSVMVFRDITERKRAEEEIRLLNEELKRNLRELDTANKELEAFSYSVSHDLRSPLRSVTGFSQVLLDDYAERLDDEGRHLLDRIIAGGRRMEQLISDLLNLSRVSRSEMRCEQVDLSAMAWKIAEEFRIMEPERKVEFGIADGLIVTGDGHLLYQVIENLLSNAWKFTEKRDTARIEFGLLQRGGERIYFLRDNGAGFDMAYADKLFNPFQRLHRASEYSGTGIGLATVKRIVGRHGGRVWIEGEVEKGSTVYFTLP